MLLTLLILHKLNILRINILQIEKLKNSLFNWIAKIQVNRFVKLKMAALLILFSCINSAFIINPEPKGATLLLQMISHTKKMNRMSYLVKKTERISGKHITQISHIEFNKNPFKVYLKQKYPNDGLEVLFVEDKNNNKAKINPNGFPWVKLNLSPLNSKMRNNQHHTIYESGFDYFNSILLFLMRKYEYNMDKMIKNNGGIEWNGISCWEIEIKNISFSYVPYQVKTGETVISIAKKLHVSAYLILEKNSKIPDYGAIKSNTLISVPSDYTKKIRLLIDKKKMIPCLIEIEDDEGLFEKYEISDFQLRKPEDFNFETAIK